MTAMERDPAYGQVGKADEFAALLEGVVVDPAQGPQEGVRLATWPRSPDCRDTNCHKCPGSAWDLEADQEVPCRHDCHPEAS